MTDTDVEDRVCRFINKLLEPEEYPPLSWRPGTVTGWISVYNAQLSMLERLLQQVSVRSQRALWGAALKPPAFVREGKSP